MRSAKAFNICGAPKLLIYAERQKLLKYTERQSFQYMRSAKVFSICGAPELLIYVDRQRFLIHVECQSLLLQGKPRRQLHGVSRVLGRSSEARQAAKVFKICGARRSF